MDNITGIIREYAGTTLTKSVLSNIELYGKMKRRQQYVEVGSYVFFVRNFCTCDKHCGGIFCDPCAVYEMVGIKMD